MTHPHENHAIGIAEQAELEIWQGIRDDTRRRLLKTVTVGVIYLIAALAVGAYLIVTIADVGRENVVLRGWQPVVVDVGWMLTIATGYGALAVTAFVGYLVTLLWIQDKLPAAAFQIVDGVPWIGSTIRVVAMGEFCQSIFQSLLRSQPIGVALDQASSAVGHAGMRRWSALASKRIEFGHPLAHVLQSSPIQDPPLSAVAAFAMQKLPASDSVDVWRRATSECHLLAQSRLDRTAMAVSVCCLLASVFIAFFALLLSGIAMRTMLQGLTY
ncbi:hypothetical protein Mal15_31470 [Stieleria maiorica]|uniref:Bacterial type II secretion system protein F domain protein n=1 Tax=Stieleria maiorica TaxID=2795974 RepID=A0A5B9MJ76_9BACT|nr:hypothetical protein [Stieleria maiorica]QEF99087.1 hypothetical protein Mal15_31470 [Stieleria maiorica]